MEQLGLNFFDALDTFDMASTPLSWSNLLHEISGDSLDYSIPDYSIVTGSVELSDVFFKACETAELSAPAPNSLQSIESLWFPQEAPTITDPISDLGEELGSSDRFHRSICSNSGDEEDGFSEILSNCENLGSLSCSLGGGSSSGETSDHGSYESNKDINIFRTLRSAEIPAPTLKKPRIMEKVYEPDAEAIAQVKMMIYRAAVMRPVNLGAAAAAEKPKRKNVRISSDPQTVAARQRRERIGERLRVLQKLVPGGSKMDTASMLDEAANYLKFLKSQLIGLEKFGTRVDGRTSGGGGGATSGLFMQTPFCCLPKP